MSDTKMHGPIKTEVKVYFVIDDTGQEGAVTVELDRGVFPTAEDMREAIQDAEEAVEEHGGRLMDRKEFYEALMGEMTGQRIAIAGVPEEWDGSED